jgi:GTPase SAR1 family protein
MVIVEGPDGSGKTSLIKKLQTDLNIPIHERFCHSDGTPIQGESRSSLFTHAYQDTISLDEQPVSLYDRHCLISEYVYGPIIRGELPPEFDSPQATRMIKRLASASLLVLCMPPLHRLIKSVGAQTQMDGVTDRIASIRAAYTTMGVFWPGRIIHYNFDVHTTDYYKVINACRMHIVTRESELKQRFL